ncbi:hypothetical protein BC629DRAFT_949261 [Irpex lacteus]|nr:hypothetical protein BC629DRAFT_949261 [Irpex lacteus]
MVDLVLHCKSLWTTSASLPPAACRDGMSFSPSGTAHVAHMLPVRPSPSPRPLPSSCQSPSLHRTGRSTHPICTHALKFPPLLHASCHLTYPHPQYTALSDRCGPSSSRRQWLPPRVHTTSHACSFVWASYAPQRRNFLVTINRRRPGRLHMFHTLLTHAPDPNLTLWVRILNYPTRRSSWPQSNERVYRCASCGYVRAGRECMQSSRCCRKTIAWRLAE